MILFIFIDRDDRRYLFLRLQLDQIHDRRTSGRPAALRNLIGFHPIHSSHICKKHNIVMGSCHKQFLNIILINGLHSFNTFSASVLAFEGIHRHTLDISEFCHSDDRIFSWNQIFHGNIVYIKSDRGPSLIPIFVTDQNQLIFDHSQKKFFIGKNRL